MSSDTLLHLFHIAFVGPLFLYISLRPLSPWMFHGILALGLILLAYQGYKTFVKLANGAPGYKINLFHVLVIAPLLIYIGYRQPDATDFVYQLLLMATFAVVGYHAYYLFADQK